VYCHPPKGSFISRRVDYLDQSPFRRAAFSATSERHKKIFLGIILVILGLVLPSLIPTFAFAHVLLVIGVILLVVGVILAVLGSRGRAVGGRRHYY
jgi:uncharacterized membrane protein HdeD (DUF308 family)